MSRKIRMTEVFVVSEAEATDEMRPENRDLPPFSLAELRELAERDPYFEVFRRGGRNMVKEMGDEWPNIFDGEGEDAPYVSFFTRSGVLYMKTSREAPSLDEWQRAYGMEGLWEEDPEGERTDPRGRVIRFVPDEYGGLKYEFTDPNEQAKLDREAKRGWSQMTKMFPAKKKSGPEYMN